MFQFLVKRLIGLVFVVLGVTFITFIIGYAAPGDPIRSMMDQHFDLTTWLRLRHAYGLDLPWYQQYYNFLVHLFHFDLGLSYQHKNRPVSGILADGLPISIELGVWGLAIALIIGIPSGIWSAIKANTWVDTTIMAVALILYAVPVFVLCIFAQVFIFWLNTSFHSQWPVSIWSTPWQYTWTDIQHKLAPILVYSLAGYAYFARLARTSMLDVLRQDYVRTARAKGLYEYVIIYRHALRNAMIPIITYLGVMIGLLVTGVFFIEVTFSIQGIARITVEASTTRDYPVIQATVVVIAIGTVVGNLIADILYTVLDPRIKLS